MKLLRASLLALFLGSSSASAASFYFGVRLDGSTVFEDTGYTTITTVIAMIGLQAGVDFDSPSSGFGLRFALSTQVVSGGRGAMDGYFRFPIQPDLSSYVGAGATVLVASNPFFSWVYTHWPGSSIRFCPTSPCSPRSALALHLVQEPHPVLVHPFQVMVGAIRWFRSRSRRRLV